MGPGISGPPVDSVESRGVFRPPPFGCGLMNVGMGREGCAQTPILFIFVADPEWVGFLFPVVAGPEWVVFLFLFITGPERVAFSFFYRRP